MSQQPKITVSQEPLLQILRALNNDPQVQKLVLAESFVTNFDGKNPIEVLTDEYNAWLEDMLSKDPNGSFDI